MRKLNIEIKKSSLEAVEDFHWEWSASEKRSTHPNSKAPTKVVEALP